MKIGPSGNWVTNDGEEIPGTAGAGLEAAASRHRSRHEHGLDKAEAAAKAYEREALAADEAGKRSEAAEWAEKASKLWDEASSHHQAMSKIVKGEGGKSHAYWAEETRLHARRTAREAADQVLIAERVAAFKAAAGRSTLTARAAAGDEASRAILGSRALDVYATRPSTIALAAPSIRWTALRNLWKGYVEGRYAYQIVRFPLDKKIALYREEPDGESVHLAWAKNVPAAKKVADLDLRRAT